MSNIANLWKDHFSAVANSVGSTDNRDQVMNALDSVPGHNYVINVHKLRQIVRGLKIKKAVGYDGIPSEVYKFASERLLTIPFQLYGYRVGPPTTSRVTPAGVTRITLGNSS